MKVTQEKNVLCVNGFLALLYPIISIPLIVFSVRWFVILFNDAEKIGGIWMPIVLAVVLFLLMILSGFGFLAVQPNEGRVLTFFGRYIGTLRSEGFWWANPFSIKPRVSLRIRNFSSETLKVNDADGNPIEIAAVVVWQVVDTAKAVFDVDNYEEFVSIQSETALRGLASRYPYDNHDDGGASLRGSRDEVSVALKEEVEDRLKVAGVEVYETRLSHLAYAPEIAQAMLRRQQAQAIIAARKQIVEGAVGMVQMALQQLSEKNIVELDEERKATMVNNLLVVLTSEQESQPIINAGSLY